MTTADTHSSLPRAERPTGRAALVRYTLAEQGSPWIFVVAERAAVAIKAPSEPDVVEGLWALMRAGESRVDTLAAALPEFSGERRTVFLVVGDDDVVNEADDSAAAFLAVIAHGSAAIDVLIVDDAEPSASTWRRVAAEGDAPWVRERIEGVLSVTLGDLSESPGAPGEGVSFPLDAGVVVANRIDAVTPRGLQYNESQGAPLSDVEAAIDEWGDPAENAVVDDAFADAFADDAVYSEETILTRRPVAGAPRDSEAAASDAHTLDLSDRAGGMDGAPLTKAPGEAVSVEAETETVIRPRRTVVPRLADDGLLQHDGETVLRPDIVRPIEDETVFRQMPYVADDPQTVMYGFRVNGGQAYPLDAVHYFGRNPRQPRIPLPDPSRLVPVVSSTKSVSATHLEIKQVGDSIVATDLKSTNGTSVNLPHKHWQRLRQGESIVVVPGTLIDIGDGNVIEILPPWQNE